MAILLDTSPSVQERYYESKQVITSKGLNTTNKLSYPYDIPVVYYKEPVIINNKLYIYPMLVQKDNVAILIGDESNPDTTVLTYDLPSNSTYYVYVKYTYTGDTSTQQTASIVVSDSELNTDEYLYLFRITNYTIMDMNDTLKSYYDRIHVQPRFSNYSKVVRVESKGYVSTIGDRGVWIDGNKIFTPGRSYGLLVLDRNDGSVVYSGTYDIFTDPTQADMLASRLSSYNDHYIVILCTYDEPQANRLNDSLIEQILRCGGSRSVFENPDFKYRSAYILIGIPGIGEENGIELYKGEIDSDSDAWIKYTFVISDGEILSSPTGTKLVNGRLAFNKDVSLVGDGNILRLDGNTFSMKNLDNDFIITNDRDKKIISFDSNNKNILDFDNDNFNLALKFGGKKHILWSGLWAINSPGTDYIYYVPDDYYYGPNLVPDASTQDSLIINEDIPLLELTLVDKKSKFYLNITNGNNIFEDLFARIVGFNPQVLDSYGYLLDFEYSIVRFSNLFGEGRDRYAIGIRIKSDVEICAELSGNFYTDAELYNYGFDYAYTEKDYSNIHILNVTDLFDLDEMITSVFDERDFSRNGYQKLPSGLIIQWGYYSGPYNGTHAVTLPIEFRYTCLWALGYSGRALDYTDDNYSGSAAVTYSKSQIMVTTDHGYPTSWIAIGY